MILTTNPHRNPLNPAFFNIPEPPEAFGQDGGKFYACYDEFAEEIDDDMTGALKEQLDGLLLFAGIFASVNSTFLALTIPLLYPSASDDTNALITQTNAILLQMAAGRNDSLPTLSLLPSTSFIPSADIVAMNVLFSLSLTTAIVASFLATLGRQWIADYRKRGGGGPDHRRWSQLQRFLGAKRWRLELILDDILPSLLQIGLIIFCTALAICLRFYYPVTCLIAVIPMCLGLVIFVGGALCTSWDEFCPFQSPLSHLFFRIAHSPPLTGTLSKKTFSSFPEAFRDATQSLSHPGDTFIKIIKAIQEIVFKAHTSAISFGARASPLISSRRGETVETLQVIALQRALCTSEDQLTLLAAVANIPTVGSSTELKKLWDDKAFGGGFLAQYQNSYNRTLQLLGRTQVRIALATKRLYGAAVTHFLFHFDDFPDTFHEILSRVRAVEGIKPLATQAIQELSDDLSPVFVRTTLSHALISVILDQPSSMDIQVLCHHLNSCSDALKYPEWRLLSLISWAISQFPRIECLNASDFHNMGKAFRGDVDTASESINQAFEVILARRNVYTLDCDRVLTNLLRCSSQVVTDECSHPDMRMDQSLVLLRCAENVLRSGRGLDEDRMLVRRIRTVVVLKFRSICFREDTVYSKILDVSQNVLRTLASLFQPLLQPAQIPPCHREDAEFLEVFSPLVEDILAWDAVFKWENEAYSADDAPETLRQELETLRRVFEAFTADADDTNLLGATQQRTSDSEVQGSPNTTFIEERGSTA